MKTLNIKLFRKIRDRITEVPESYDQQTYLRSNPKAPCGTAACLAGEAIICNAPNVKEGIRRLNNADDDNAVAEIAAELLKLPLPVFDEKASHAGDNVTARLFRCGSGINAVEVFWPEPFRTRFNKAKTDRGRAKAAVALLDHIISTGKVPE